jgi:LysM repeat protein
MSSLRNFALILFLAGVGWAVYVAINKPAKLSTPLDTAPAWNPPQVSLPVADVTALRSGATGGLPPLTAPPIASSTPSGPTSVLPQIATPSVPEVPSDLTGSPAPGISLIPTRNSAKLYPPNTAPAGNVVPATVTATPAPASTAATATANLSGSSTPAASGTSWPPPTILTPANPQSAATSGPTRPGFEGNATQKSPFVMVTVKAQLDAGRYDDALLTLSKVYREPQVASLLAPDDFRQITDLLDQLAGTVIYSHEHFLAPAYRVQPGDTLDGIAQRCNVPSELLAKINGIRDAQQLVPGQELKIIPGPFEAVVDLSRYELTLFVHDRYAGRFSIGVGLDQPQLEGTFMVREKRLNPLYRGQDRVFTGDDPNNPLGRRLLDLGNQVAIHGTDNPRSIGRTEGQGVIRLAERELCDVYDILSVGSRVTIRR